MYSLWGSTPSPFSSREKCISAQRSPSETQHPRILMWDWSYRRPLPSNYQSSGLLEGKQVLSINLIVCTHSLCIVNLLYQLENRAIAVKAKFPDTSQGLPLQASLSRESGFKSAVLHFFLHSAQIWNSFVKMVSTDSECRVSLGFILLTLSQGIMCLHDACMLILSLCQ